MTLNTELKALKERTIALPLDWQIAVGQQVTEENLEAAKKAQRYANRENMPESYLPFADLYNELTGQEPTKRVIQDWMMTFEEWKQEKLLHEHIRAAWLQANEPDKGFTVGRPGALTVTAVGIKSRMTKTAQPEINTAAIVETLKAADNKWNMEFVPRPANIERPKNIPASRKARR